MIYRIAMLLAFITITLLSPTVSSAAPDDNATLPPKLSHLSLIGSTAVRFTVRDAMTGYTIPATISIWRAQWQFIEQVYPRNFEQEQQKEKLIDTFVMPPEGFIIKHYPKGRYLVNITAPNYRTFLSYDLYLLVESKPSNYTMRTIDPLTKQDTTSPGTLDPPKTPDTLDFMGYVVNKNTGHPLKDVAITFVTSRVTTSTNARGYYVVTVPVTERIINPEDPEGDEITGHIEEITIVREGYIPQRWTNYLIRPGVFHNGPIEMTPTHKGQPGQVYETDYGPQPKIRDDQPSPIIQKDSYDPQQSNSSRVFSGTTTLQALPLNATTSTPLNFLQPPQQQIKVGFKTNSSGQLVSCSKNDCTTVLPMLLEDYVKRGLLWEWVGSWEEQAKRAGQIAYRSYGAYYMLHSGKGGTTPDGPFNICSSEQCQNIEITNPIAHQEYPVRYTAGIMLHRNGQIAEAEHSAENNNLCPQSTSTPPFDDGPLCTGGGYAWTTCHDGSVGRTDPTYPQWPCLPDIVSTPLTNRLSGHGGGMSQQGTKRWALKTPPPNTPNSRLWPWIVNHYYNANGGTDGPATDLRTAYLTSPLQITLGSVAPTPVNPGQPITVSTTITSSAGATLEGLILHTSLQPHTPSVGPTLYPPDKTSQFVNPSPETLLTQQLTLPAYTSFTGTTPIAYDLTAEVWLHPKTTPVTLDPTNDVLIASQTFPNALTVMPYLPLTIEAITMDSPPTTLDGVTMVVSDGITNDNIETTEILHYPNSTQLTIANPNNTFGTTNDTTVLFQKWQLDNVDFATALTTTLTLDAPRTLTAVYVKPARYEVTSAPLSGLSITIDTPDIFDHTDTSTLSNYRWYPSNILVTFTAPTINNSFTGCRFQTWQLNGYTLPGNPLALTTSGPGIQSTLTAAYDVKSPITGKCDYTP